MFMKLADLRHLNNLDLLKYLAYLQVCQENSSHLQILQELQNRVLKGEDIISDESLWKELDDTQTGLFVENYICRGVGQFRAFVADASERPWQLCVLVESLIYYKKLSIFGLSINAAIFHGIGQVLVVSIIYQTIQMFNYIIVLTISGIISGYLIALVIKLIIEKMPKSLLNIK